MGLDGGDVLVGFLLLRLFPRVCRCMEFELGFLVLAGCDRFGDSF